MDTSPNGTHAFDPEIEADLALLERARLDANRDLLDRVHACADEGELNALLAGFSEEEKSRLSRVAWHVREKRLALREASGLNPNGTPKA